MHLPIFATRTNKTLSCNKLIRIQLIKKSKLSYNYDQY